MISKSVSTISVTMNDRLNMIKGLLCQHKVDHYLVPNWRRHLWLSLQWCHNEHDDVSNLKPHDCLLNRLFKAQIKENTKALRHWPVTGEFPTQMASNAENVSIWWRHHGWRWPGGVSPVGDNPMQWNDNMTMSIDNCSKETCRQIITRKCDRLTMIR